MSIREDVHGASVPGVEPQANHALANPGSGWNRAALRMPDAGGGRALPGMAMVDGPWHDRFVERIRRFCRLVWTAWAIAAATAVQAVVVVDPGVAGRNESEPTGALAGSGWQWTGRFNAFCGVPVGPSTFITARHIGGSVGDLFHFKGRSYRTVLTEVDPESDLAVWHVVGQFDGVAPVVSTDLRAGDDVVLLGRGARRGAEIRVDRGGGLELAGWQWGSVDGVLRWGTNTVKDRIDGSQIGLYGPLVHYTFDAASGADEGCLSVGDSGGPLFVRRNGQWQLAAVHFAVEAAYRTSEEGETRNGTVFDYRGLYRGSGVAWELVPLSGDGPSPASMFSTRIQPRSTWLTAAVGRAPAAPVLESASGVGVPFSPAVDFAHDPVARRFTVAISGEMRIFRLRGPVAVTVTRVERSGSLMTLDYE